MVESLLTFLIASLFLALIGFLFWPQKGIFWKWQKRRRRSERVLVEDALKYVFKCERRDRTPTLESIAGMLSISLDRATEIMDRTRERDLVELKEEGFKLTERGRNIALQIVRAHRLWERYLADSTGYTEEEWHQQAETFEHQLSVDEMDRLSAQLGRPIYDPHGDPIPTSRGEFFDHEGKPITALEEGDLARIVHIEDEPEMVYAQIVAEGLRPQMVVRLEEKSPKRIRLWSEDQEFILAPMIAANLSVLPLREEVYEEEQRGVPLDRLGEGQRGEVLGISSHIRGLDRRRLLDLGILPGTEVSVEMVSPSGDPIAYRIRDSVIALRSSQTKHIRVLPQKDKEKAE
ncbi:MAG: metal-dependent transcriptional regulator [Anaerolineales bacterium]